MEEKTGGSTVRMRPSRVLTPGISLRDRHTGMIPG